jgi:transcriptional regulator with XRE-family HTH domain
MAVKNGGLNSANFITLLSEIYEVKNNLKQIRIEKGLSLEQLGEMCGKGEGAIWELEQEKTEPKLRTAYIISKVLDVGIFDIWPDCVEIVEETIIVRRVRTT